jgi:hypothetical protein
VCSKCASGQRAAVLAEDAGREKVATEADHFCDAKGTHPFFFVDLFIFIF